MARPRPQVATTTAVLILFLVAEVVSSGEATTIVLRPPNGGSNRHTMFLLFFSLSPPSSYSSNSSPFVHCQIQGSDPLHPNARMLLYDDLLLNESRNWPKHMTCVPPLLPPLKEIYPGNIVDDLIGVRAVAERHIEEICAENINKFRSDKSRKINRSSLSVLFISFLKKFADIGSRASEKGICP